MHPVFAKTFGGLSPQYYFRQLFFSLVLLLMCYLVLKQAPGQTFMIAFFVINTFLYPYSRFVYERIINFIIGENAFWLNAIFMLAVKFFTMILCWWFAFIIAPFGLIFLYFHHTKKSSEHSEA